MAGSTFGTIFRITTFGESHGEGIGAVVDGCPAGLAVSEEQIQSYLDLRKPGQTKYATKRKEADRIRIMSGVFEGKTTGTPILLLAENTNQRSGDYSELASVFRPGHADYTFQTKYGLRDYRGGGRSSGRETLGRVAAGAIAIEFLKTLGIELCAYTKSIGSVACRFHDYTSLLTEQSSDYLDRIAPEQLAKLRALKSESTLFMPDKQASELAEAELASVMEHHNSVGGTIECIVTGMPVGIGDPVFEKLDAKLAQAILSIGAVKGFALGSGFDAASSYGLDNNDAFVSVDGQIRKATNHAGGILGGISDGSDIVFQAAVKPTPSVYAAQSTVTMDKTPTTLEIKGRHDPVIVPRAVVVVEAMTALTIADALLINMSSRLDNIKQFYS